MKFWMAVAALVMSGSAFAGPRSPGIDARQVNQGERIVQGVANGSLTRVETKRLMSQQRKVRRTERAFESDGRLTAAERYTLHGMQNRSSRAIYRQKHDGQTQRRY